MEAPDSPPLSIAVAAAQATTEAALAMGTATGPALAGTAGSGSQAQGVMPGAAGPAGPSMIPAHRSASVGGSNVMRSQNSFSREDHFFRVRGLGSPGDS